MSTEESKTNVSSSIDNKWNYDWMKCLTINDQVDVYDTLHNVREYEDTWMIGKIIDMKIDNNIYQFNISYDGWHLHSDCSNLQNWVTINYDLKHTPRNIKFAKLNTFTPIHSYLIDKSFTQQICAWYHNAKYRKCTICHKNICIECMALKHDNTQQIKCKLCIQLMEYKQIYSTIYENVSKITFMETNIIKILAEYSVGCIVNCCNSEKCTNEIYFNSSFEIDHSLRFPWKYEQKLWQYCAKRDMSETLFLCNKYRRIFCGECYLYKLKRCKYPQCNRNKEIQLFGHKTICKNHKKCFKCGFGLDSTEKICNICDNVFHFDCVKFDRFDVCNKCKMDNKMELSWNILIKAIDCSDEWLQKHIISVIEGYIVDYIVNCCCCNDMIVIKHKMQFEQNLDDENNRISSYILKYGGRVLKSVCLYGDMRRVFCWRCTNDLLTVCQAPYCYNKDVKYGSEEYFLCKKHPICAMCNHVNYYNIHYCSKCGGWLRYKKSIQKDNNL